MSESTVKTATPIWPTLSYRDARAAIDFLERAFGFEAAFVAARDVVEHAELTWPGGGGIMLGQVREDMAIKEQPPGVGSVYIVVGDPDAVYARAEAAGATIIRALRDETEYESRGFVCRDPEGVYWSFGTYAGAAKS
ncbi:VOC family protein [Nocardia huaxiensis]|uniref:VOC family protein n=1 Tax=Nocardia huaxiensis TaxID=2755382 RepID=A0A7D6ZQH3_9NOCA|nr:VOC family protein [Nocardia huaxiensis]QLY32863.1 VOC family protein [Nocardia huaxiensis]UFS93382.1 VOC family protein [Nocardia huaxiensis]